MSFEWLVRIIQDYWMLFVKGTVVTLEVSLLGTVIGYVLGFLVGLVQSSPTPKDDKSVRAVIMRILKVICRVYVTVFRGTPMIVQAMVIYYGSLMALHINIASFAAAVIVLSVNTGAYMAETVRGGIQSVSDGQYEGAKALGMSHTLTMLHVVIPQAFRNVLPQMCNMFVANIKDTSVLNVISVTELFFTTKTISGTTYKYFEAYCITACIYLVLTIFFDKVFKLVEKKTAMKDNYVLVDVDEYEKELNA